MAVLAMLRFFIRIKVRFGEKEVRVNWDPFVESKNLGNLGDASWQFSRRKLEFFNDASSALKLSFLVAFILQTNSMHNFQTS